MLDLFLGKMKQNITLFFPSFTRKFGIQAMHSFWIQIFFSLLLINILVVL